MNRRTLYPLTPWVVWVLALPLALGMLGAAVFGMTEAGDMPIDNPDLWWLWGAVFWACLFWMYGLWRRRRAVEGFASVGLAPLLAARVSAVRPAIRAGLTVLAVGLIIAAIIGPRWGMYLQQQKVRGIDVIIALDVSRSMLASDIEPTRLARAKRNIRQQFTERAVFRHAHRLGLIAFAGSTSLRIPLTTDHLAFRTQLGAVGIGSAGRGGTAIAEAIRAAADLFRTSPEQATKIVVLFTDGEDHEGGPVEAARKAFEEQRIRVFTVGMGDPSRTYGAEVPIGTGGERKPLLHDGQIVFSKLDVAGLREIAEAGGGRYAAAGDLHRLVDVLADFRQEDLTTEERRRHKPRYQWFLAAALMLLGFETMISERLSRAVGGPQRIWQQEAS